MHEHIMNYCKKKKKTWCQHGYCHAHMVPKDAIAMPGLNLTYCALSATHTTYPPPKVPAPKLTIQLIEFTYCNDRFAAKTLDRKITKYQPLTQPQHHNTRMECSPTRGISHRCKGHNTHSVDEKLRNNA